MPSEPEQILPLDKLQQLAMEPEQAQTHMLSILGSLASDDEEVRAYASDCLEQIEAPEPAALAQLASHCTAHYAPVANWACKLLGRIGTTACQAPLIAALNEHESIGVRQQAALALTKIADLQPGAIAALKQAALSDDPRLQRIAQQGLEKSN